MARISGRGGPYAAPGWRSAVSGTAGRRRPRSRSPAQAVRRRRVGQITSVAVRTPGPGGERGGPAAQERRAARHFSDGGLMSIPASPLSAVWSTVAADERRAVHRRSTPSPAPPTVGIRRPGRHVGQARRRLRQPSRCRRPLLRDGAAPAPRIPDDRAAGPAQGRTSETTLVGVETQSAGSKRTGTVMVIHVCGPVSTWRCQVLRLGATPLSSLPASRRALLQPVMARISSGVPVPA